jgi:coenzyme F420-reducing hydrogenase delta subunit
VEYLKEVLKSVGVEPERIRIAWCTAAEGQKFQKTAIEFDKVIRELGPSPLKSKGSTPEKKKAKERAKT